MRPMEAVQLAGNLTFRPGWTIQASVLDDRRVYVDFTVNTVDTSYPSENGTYGKTITLMPDFTVDVSGMDADQFLYEVLRKAIEADTHEAREFLRVKQADGSWKAPFHPHNDDGNVKWEMARLNHLARKLGV
jgi:hypothetical protein